MFSSRRILLSEDKYEDNFAWYLKNDDYMTVGQFDYTPEILYSFWIGCIENADNTIFSQGTDANNYIKVMTYKGGYATTNRIRVDIKNSGTSSILTADLGSDLVGKWTHVVIGINNSYTQCGIHLNGKSAISSGSMETVQDFTGDLHIGTDFTNLTGDEFHGYISDFAIYDDTPSGNALVSRVKVLYNDREPFDHSLGPFKDNLKYWGRMYDDPITQLTPSDLSGVDTVLNTGIIIKNSVGDFSISTIYESDFSSDADNFTAIDSDATIARSTDISGPNGETGVLKYTCTVNNETNLAKLDANVSNVEAGAAYIITGYYYYVSGEEFVNQYIYNFQPLDWDSSLQISNGFSSPETTNSWQKIKSFCYLPTTATDVTGGMKIVWLGAGAAIGDIIYMSNFKIEKIVNPGVGLAKGLASGVSIDPNPFRISAYNPFSV